MKSLLKSKVIVSSMLAGALLLSISPLGGIEAASLNNGEVLSTGSAAAGYNSKLNLIQESPVSVAAASNSEQRVIVTFKDKKKVNKSLIQAGKGKIKRENKHVPSLTVTMPLNEVEKLKKDPTVESVEPDIQLQAASQTMDWGVSVVNATYAWNSGNTGKGVKVAVLDSGIDTHHEDLAVEGGVSFVDYTTSYDDDYGHGTQVAGIIGAKNNEIGVVGVAPDTDLYAVKVLDSTGKGFLSDVIAGIDWAVDNKMDLINMSMATNVDSPALHNAVDQAYANGLLVVAAAGNSGNPEGTGDTIQYPAKYSSVIAVGAVDQQKQRASFSATGEELEIVAPGVGVKSTSTGNSYSSANGTSLAAPFVVGELALLKQQHPLLSNMELRNALDTHVSDVGVTGKDLMYGYGLLNILSTSDSQVIDVPEPSVTDGVYNSVYGNVYAAIASIGTVSLGANVPINILDHKQSTLADGGIMITGGRTDNGFINGNSYIYNLSNNTWTQVASLPIPRAYHGQSTLKDGRVFITGGSNGSTQISSSYIYDPSTNTWTRAADLPIALQHIAQSTLADGRVIVTGGTIYNKAQNVNNLQSSVFIYSPQTNSWSRGADVPYTVMDHAQSVLPDGRLMITGGFVTYDSFTSSNTAIYNPVTNTWISSAKLPVLIAMHTQSTLPDGRVFVAFANGQNTYIYDDSTKLWIAGVNMPQSTYSTGAMSATIDGKVIFTSSMGNSKQTVIFSFNLTPVLNVNNNNQIVWSQSGFQTITLSGAVSDRNNDNLTISATINGVTKSTVVSNVINGQPWSLQWDINNDHIPNGTYSNLAITVNDGDATATVNYTGTITVEQAPYAPLNVSPGSATSTTPVLISPTPTLSWTFSDPDAGDSQSAYDVLIYNSNGTSLIRDSGWINSSANSYTVPAGTLTSGTTYSWIVKVKDSKGAVSPNSTLMYIRINTKPTLTLTSYANGQQVPDNILHFTWTYADADGQAQKAYQVLGSQDNWATVGYNSGAINSVNAFMDTPALASGTWNFKVLVSDGIEWSTEVLRTNLVLPNAFEPNDTTAQAYSINYNQTYSSYISSATDVDYFKYTAPTSGVDRLAMTVPSGLNYEVYIYDSSSNLVAASVRGTSIAENVLFDVTAGNVYYVKIVGVGGNYSTSATYSFTLAKLSMQLQTNYQYDSNGNIIGKTTTKSN